MVTVNPHQQQMMLWHYQEGILQFLGPGYTQQLMRLALCSTMPCQFDSALIASNFCLPASPKLDLRNQICWLVLQPC